jgi:hypothetical protein
MKYAVMFEPFDGLEYVCKSKTDYQLSGDEPLLFETKWMAQQEADKWNTGIVVEYRG